jgi:hypothetical protein
VHPRLASVDLGNRDNNLELNVEERERQFEEQKRKALEAIDAAFGNARARTSRSSELFPTPLHHRQPNGKPDLVVWWYICDLAVTPARMPSSPR